MIPVTSTYPGDQLTAKDVFLWAEAYRKIAALLLDNDPRDNPLTRAPYSLIAIQAIELYLNAFLQFNGLKPSELRRLQHDLAARANLARASGLRLRKRTAAHLVAMKTGREYLVSRYGTAQINSLSQISRLKATLEEICAKVGKRLGVWPVVSAAASITQSAVT